MTHLINKDALIAWIKGRIDENRGKQTLPQYFGMVEEDLNILYYIDTLEVKEVDLELITGWFDHIAQIADDRMTLTNQRMTDAHALDEIKCLAKNSSEFITKHYKAQKGEKV